MHTHEVVAQLTRWWDDEVFEKYSSWEECVGAGFFTDPNLEKYFGSAIGDGRNPAGHANYAQCVKYGIGREVIAKMLEGTETRTATAAIALAESLLLSTENVNDFNELIKLGHRPDGDGGFFWRVEEYTKAKSSISEDGDGLGFTELPCSVKELDDIEANLLLLTGNQQEGNDPLDIGLNALDTLDKGKHNSNLNVSGFAKRLGKSQGYLTKVFQAATVFSKIIPQGIIFDPTDRSKHLTEIHAAPESTWALLAGLLQEHSWTVKETKAAVDRIRSVADLVPDWP